MGYDEHTCVASAPALQFDMIMTSVADKSSSIRGRLRKHVCDSCDCSVQLLAASRVRLRYLCHELAFPDTVRFCGNLVDGVPVELP